VGGRPSALLAEFEIRRPDLARAAQRFYDGFLRAGMTRSEQWMMVLASAMEFLKGNSSDSLHEIMDDLITEIDDQDCERARESNLRHRSAVDEIVDLLDFFDDSRTRESMEPLLGKCSELHRRLKIENDAICRLNLLSVAPELDRFHDVGIAVPGTYVVGLSVVTMHGISHTVIVFHSKQRPKQVGIFGSDGREYFYLLKNREDLRLDQRAMQFFALINTLISSRIVTYFVMPLSLSAGLIQWIKGSDTMSKLIRDYRTNHGIMPALESRKMSALTIDSYDLLRPI
jgi:FKBP12-rapamycin complex-associated protein